MPANSSSPSALAVQSRIGPRRFVYQGIPQSARQRNVRYSIFADKQGNKELRLHVDDKGGALRWKLKPAEDGQGAKAERLPTRPNQPDDDGPDIQEESSGVMQIHKSNPNEIYGTMQDGKLNQSIRLVRGQDGNGWDLQPAKSPRSRGASALDFVGAVKSKTAGVLLGKPDISIPQAQQKPIEIHNRAVAMDKLTWPLTGNNFLGQTVMTGGLGLLAGAGYHGFKKLRGLLTGEEDDGSTLLGDMGRFGLAGAAVPAVWKGLESLAGGNRPGSPISPDEAMRATKDLGVPVNDARPHADYSKIAGYSVSASAERAASYGASNLDYRQVINAIRNDTMLSSMEREQLIAMARQASEKRLPVDPGALTSAGLMALAGYIMSKLMGMGGVGQAAMAGAGAAMGYAAGQSPESVVRSRTGYTYN